MFVHGRITKTDNVRMILSQEDDHDIFELYTMKFWGLVDEDTWKQNNENAKNGGKIVCRYRTKEGNSINLIRIEDCSRLFILTEQDIVDSFMETFLERIEEERRAMQEYINSRERQQSQRPRRGSRAIPEDMSSFYISSN